MKAQENEIQHLKSEIIGKVKNLQEQINSQQVLKKANSNPDVKIKQAVENNVILQPEQHLKNNSQEVAAYQTIIVTQQQIIDAEVMSFKHWKQQNKGRLLVSGSKEINLWKKNEHGMFESLKTINITAVNYFLELMI